MYSTGFSNIMTQNNAPEKDIDKIVLVTVLGY